MSELQEIIEIEDYFNEPEYLRARVLNELTFYPCAELGGKWPGLRTEHLHVIEPELFNKIAGLITTTFGITKDEKVDILMSFQLCSESDGGSWIHQDRGIDYVMMVYLTPDPPPNSGTILYSPIDVGFDHYNMAEPSNFTKKLAITNKFNKFISHDPREFHKSDEYFGDSPENSRLFLIAFLSFPRSIT
jgi:hypothetical protein